MKVLDMVHPIGLDDIYTDVNILTRIPSKCWHDFSQFQCHRREFDRLGYGEIVRERVPGLTAVEQHSKLLILGKPGAGKTTFLKRLIIQCISGIFQSNLVPVFITLREFAVSDGHPNLRDYINTKMHSDGVTESELELILHHGKAFVLLDGLDEVKVEQSSRVIDQICEFVQLFSKNRFVMTCRTAAREYIFEQFTDVEVADFNDNQINDFVNKWFRCRCPENSQDLIKKFHQKLDGNTPSKELATNPLLLTLLCLVFEELKDFPRKRSHLYKEGLSLLLQKWDNNRNIERWDKRPELYKKLDPQQKEDLLINIAYKNFNQDRYFFEQDEVEEDIVAYIQNLPEATTDHAKDSKAILKGIEAQHGLLVERARRIYSFSHLTFQEYFTARRIVNSSDPNEQELAFQSLVCQVTNKQWREIFLLTVEMLPNSDYLLTSIKEEVDKIVSQDKAIQDCLKWLYKKTTSINHKYKPACVRADYFEPCLEKYLQHFLTKDNGLPYDLSIDVSLKIDLGLAIGSNPEVQKKMAGLDYGLDRTIDSKFDKDLYFEVQRGKVSDRSEIMLRYAKMPNRALVLDRSLKIVRDPQLKQELQNLKAQIPGDPQETEKWWIENGKTWTENLRNVMIKHRDIGQDWKFTDEQYELLKHYYNANLLLVDCLNSCHYVSRTVREEIENNLLLPLERLPQLP